MSNDNTTQDITKVPEDKEYEASKQLFESNTYQQQLHAVVSALVKTKPKALGRVLRKLVLEPLDGINDGAIPLDHKEEKELYQFCKQIMYSKSVVIKNQMNKLLKEKQNESKETVG